jgi:hypothetical protein
MAKHYICTGGCGGASERPGVCQSPDCLQHGQPLEVCDCTDDRHYGAFDMSADYDGDDDEDE